MTETDKAWAAGFLDGEGCISIMLGAHQRQIYLRVSVGQIDQQPLSDLQSYFGGSIRASQNKRRYVYYEWCAFSQRAADALTVLRPYLRVKHRQADVALEFWRTCGRLPGWNTKRLTGKSVAFSEDDKQLRLSFLRQLRALNHKGQHLITLSTESY